MIRCRQPASRGGLTGPAMPGIVVTLLSYTTLRDTIASSRGGARSLCAQRPHPQRRAGRADRGVDPGVGLDQSGPGRRGRHDHRRPWPGAGGAASSASPRCRSWSPAAGARRRSAPTCIADNKLALNAGWDEELLGLELGDLEVAGLRPRPDRLRATSSRRCSSTATAGLTDPDEVPELPDQPGQHAWAMSGCSAGTGCVCGDSTDADDGRDVPRRRRART